MSNYFKRLKTHPGLGTATFMTILGTLAGASNKNFDPIWHGALFGFLLSGIICWSVVLITNIKKKKK